MSTKKDKNNKSKKTNTKRPRETTESTAESSTNARVSQGRSAPNVPEGRSNLDYIKIIIIIYYFYIQ